LKYFDEVGKVIKDDVAYCYGFVLTSGDKCRMYKKLIPVTNAGNSGGDKACYQRDASTKAFAFFVTNTLATKLSDAVTAYGDTITAAWNTLIDNVETGRRDVDFETKVYDYLTDEYLAKVSTGLTKIKEAKKTLYDDLVIEETSLKTAADNLGMDTSKTLGA